MRHHHCGTSSSRMFSPPQFHRGALLSPTFCCLPSPAPVLQSVFPMASRVSLFVTCVVDQLFPKVGMAVVDVLEHLGFNVDFPERQTCCGQPAFNSGFREEARQVARHFLDVFADSDYIVVPSGSCTSMISHHFEDIFEKEPEHLEAARRLATKVYEFSRFLIEVEIGRASCRERV